MGITGVGYCGYVLMEKDMNPYSLDEDVTPVNLAGGWRVRHRDLLFEDSLLMWQPESAARQQQTLEDQAAMLYSRKAALQHQVLRVGRADTFVRSRADSSSIIQQ